MHPVAFISKTFTATKQNYKIHDREMLTIVAAFKEWRVYLEGAPKITAIMDHEVLKYFMTSKELTPQQARWAEFLGSFVFTITYRPGKASSKPDILSRLPQLERMREPPRKSFFFMKSHTIASLSDATILDAIKKEGPITYVNGHVTVPDKEKIRRAILEAHHDSPIAGHQGVEQTNELVQQHYKWTGMTKYIKDYVTGCETCRRAKAPREKPLGKLQPLPIPTKPWES